MNTSKHNDSNRSRARITRQDLSSMKAKATKNTNLFSSLKKIVDATISETVSFVNELAHVLFTKSDSCKYNGHVLTQRQGAIWAVQPSCAKCGCEITSLHQIGKGLADTNDSDDSSIESRLTASLKQRRIDLIAVR